MTEVCGAWQRELVKPLLDADSGWVVHVSAGGCTATRALPGDYFDTLVVANPNFASFRRENGTGEEVGRSINGRPDEVVAGIRDLPSPPSCDVVIDLDLSEGANVRE